MTDAETISKRPLDAIDGATPENNPHSSSAISSLPVELLCRIFLCCVYQCELQGYPHKWIWISHVCRHWRDVALHCPELWARIIFTPNSERIDTFIQRSQTCLLTFEADPSRNYGDGRYRDLVYTYLERTVYIGGLRCNALHTLPSAPVPFGDSQSVQLPLRTLKVTMGRTLRPPIIPCSSLPYLEELRLNGSFEATKGLLQPTLKRLHLSISSSFPATQIWLDLLRDLPLLEVLCIRACTDITTSQVPLITHSSAQRTKMEYMTKLELATTAKAGSGFFPQLLDNLTLPSNVSISISLGWLSKNTLLDHASEFQKLVQLVGNSVEMTVRQSTGFVVYKFCTADPREDSQNTLTVHAIESLQHLDRILALCTRPKLTHFTAATSLFTLPLWRLLTSHHPHIVELSIRSQKAIEAFVRALLEESGVALEGGEGRSEVQERQPFFAGLRKLKFQSSVRENVKVDHPPLWENLVFAQLEAELVRRQQLGSYPGSLVVEREHSTAVYEKAWS